MERGRGGLFERARAGDHAAEAEISDLARVFARLICRGGGPSGAPDIAWEDVAQVSLLKLFSVGLDRFRGTGSEKSYLYTIVKSTMIEMSRSARRRRAREEATDHPEVAAPSNSGHRIDVEGILGRLSEECRALLERAFLHGEPYPALARALGLEESSVRAKVSRCIRKARLMLEEGGRR